jgi:hypothetical protein
MVRQRLSQKRSLCPKKLTRQALKHPPNRNASAKPRRRRKPHGKSEPTGKAAQKQ